VNEINEKWKPVVIWTAFIVINIVAAIMVGLLLDRSVFERFEFLWLGVVLIFLGIFGLRYKGFFFLKIPFLFGKSYADSIDLKRKIGQTINVIGLIAGILLFFYGVYYLIVNTR